MKQSISVLWLLIPIIILAAATLLYSIINLFDIAFNYLTLLEHIIYINLLIICAVVVVLFIYAWIINPINSIKNKE